MRKRVGALLLALPIALASLGAHAQMAEWTVLTYINSKICDSKFILTK